VGILKFKDSNILNAYGKYVGDIILYNLAGLSTNYQVTKVKFGDSNAANATPEKLEGNVLYTKNIDSIEYINNTRAKVKFHLDESELIDGTIAEIGLFSENDILFARAVVAPGIKGVVLREQHM